MDRYNISALLTKVPLEDVVGRLGIETERRGAQTRALCPFHQDTKPSLNLYPADGASPSHFHCFACGAHGTAIDLVKQVAGVEFLPAVQWLEQRFGLKHLSRKSMQLAERKVTSETALDFAQRTFNAQHNAERFKAWCNEREFNEGFLHSQGLRCITHGVLVEALQTKDLGERAELIDGLEGLGLIKRLRSRSPTEQWKLELLDQFRDCFHDGRVVIPILSADIKQPKAVGFAGRALQSVPPEGVAKYLLTSGFDKSNHLFNALNAFNAVAEALKSGQSARLYLVEGFLDALRLQALGQSAVALMGVSLSNGQLKLLKELAEDTTGSGELAYSVFLDNDSAGFGGADRVVRRLLDLRGVNLRWVGMPWSKEPALGKDPDTSLRSMASPEQAAAWLQCYDMPAEAVLLARNLGSQDAYELQSPRWNQLAASVRERALFRTALTVKNLYGRRLSGDVATWLNDGTWEWAKQLHAVIAGSADAKPPIERSLYLEGELLRAALARVLAYHGARRGELPCDEEAWQTLSSNARLFDQTALERLKATVRGIRWNQAAPFDAVHLPRKLTADQKVLDDPRRKVMPHPADLHVQQVLLNELLTQRHDRLSASGQIFSARIPAVRWYASRQEVEVTGRFPALNEPRIEWNEPKTLSFGYQIDMDVLEGDKTPSDQGMFRPFGHCWRDFMACLAQQCRAIGPRVHVLRLDAKRYYDSIQRYVVREELLKPLTEALRDHNPEGFGSMFGLQGADDWQSLEGTLESLLTGLIFGHEYSDPEVAGRPQRSDEVMGIPQGPVLSAYIGTIALFPVDDAARQFIRRTAEVGADGNWRPRVGYARYVDDVVLFAESDALLKELRELLQAKASERSISLIHKGERVRSGSPEQVMRQLNEGRGLAASAPAWEPIVGDGEADWSLGDDMPTVDRQCALQMLRHPALMDRPEDIAKQVEAAMSAPDLRVGDLGLCARWLWWQVAAMDKPADGQAAWHDFWKLWNEVCGKHGWARAFEQRGYNLLYAVEGLDKLLDPNPWQANGQRLIERDENRTKRAALARLVCQSGFFALVSPAENREHVLRRAHLVVRKAWRLVGGRAAPMAKSPQGNLEVTAIEWLCLASQELMNDSDTAPLAALQDRLVVRRSELNLAQGVVDQLRAQIGDTSADVNVGLAVDFVVSSAPHNQTFSVLTRFPRLLSSLGGNQSQRLIPHLPVLSQQPTSLYAIDARSGADGRNLYRYSMCDATLQQPAVDSQFVQVGLHVEQASAAETKLVRFEPISTSAATLALGKSTGPQVWGDLQASGKPDLGARTHLAARLFLALLAMHRFPVDDERQKAYVPFRPQLFQQGEDDQRLLHLVADPVPRDMLGVSAWYHDHDNRVQSESVPLAGADLWRVGWAVADVLGVAADMAGETGEREELLDDHEEPDEETHAKQALEDYVLRQQLRKLQGAYLSGAQIDTTPDTASSLPGTVERALYLLQSFPSDQGLDAQVQHVLMVEAESRAMALRQHRRSGDDLRQELHRVFPDVLARLPLWALTGLKLRRPTGQATPLRPELALMLALYRAQYPVPAATEVDAKAPALRMALVLAAVGIGLRGSVAALWGYAAPLGSRRMAEGLNMPDSWATPDMARLDPQGDYKAMRKRLLDGDWPALSKASPWQWMLALIGLLDAGFAQAFDLPALSSLKQVYQSLGDWQTKSASSNDAEQPEENWPFDALPRFTLQDCETVMQALPAALCALDQERGMRVVYRHGPRFGRSHHTDEFTDGSGAGWQMSKPQFTSLYANTVEEHRDKSRVLKAWTETRRIADDDLLAVHTLDFKLGKWLPSQHDAADEAKAGTAVPVQRAVRSEALDQTEAAANNKATPLIPQPKGADEQPAIAPPADTPANVASAEGLLNRWSEWQKESWQGRLGGSSSLDQEARISSHFRIALFQWRVDESYGHPIAEVGLTGLPLGKSSRDELGTSLSASPKAVFKAVQRAAQRGSEFYWHDDRKILSWPEHRRRVLLSQVLKACRELKVQLLVLPEVSVRPDTVKWLKDELLQHPGLAVLAGTYRHFGAKGDLDHLKEKLTLLWQPDKALTVPLGLEGDPETIELQRAKKYRAVAAHELFKPDSSELQPLYTEEKLVEALRGIRSRAKKGDWSTGQLIPLIEALVHGPQKLRYCMELICSELFLLTSPANRLSLEQDLAKVLQIFGGDPADAKKLVDRDIDALSKLLTLAQSNRERRSVLLVPAFTSRSNDYWHAGQASVLASGTATVFCNAANKTIGIGGSCFIGIDSVCQLKPEHAGIVRLLTPYHGWHKGILQSNCKGALSEADQALVVVDIDPVHVVSGKPRPQLLPEPMSLVAYLPIVEVVDKADNAEGLANALRNELTEKGGEDLRRILAAETFPVACGQLHTREDFNAALKYLLDAKQNGALSPQTGGEALDVFAAFFGDPGAMRERVLAWLRDRDQQPAPQAGESRLEPAWLDFLVADLTWRYSGDGAPAIRVPPWLGESTNDSTKNSGDPN